MSDPLFLAKSFDSFTGRQKIFTYRPHPGQEAVHYDPARMRLVLGGNRSGKTESGIVELIAFCFGFRPWLPHGHPNYFTPFKPPIKAQIIATDFQIVVRGVLEEKLYAYLPQGCKFEYHMPDGALTSVKFPPPWNSKIQIITHTQIKKQLVAEGWHGHICLIDEPCPKRGFTGAWRGLLDKGGFLLFTLTPVYDKQTAPYLSWFKNHLLAKAEWPGAEGSQKNDITHAFRISTYDNVGYGLKKKLVDEFAEALLPEERQTRLFGFFSADSGIVYPQFNQAHIRSKSKTGTDLVQQDYPRFIGIDPHPEKGHFAVLHCVSPDDHLHAYKTVYAPTPVVFAKSLIEAEPLLLSNPNQCVITIDPVYADKAYFGSPNSFTDELIQAGITSPIIPAPHGPGSRSNGITLIQNLLQKHAVSYDPSITSLFDEFRSYSFGPSHVPIAKNNDFLDAHRAVAQLPPLYFHPSSTPSFRGVKNFNDDIFENEVGLGM